MKKLTLSDTNRFLAGVCGGIGEYLGVDPTVVRVLWVLATLFGGAGIVAYLIFWLIMPSR